MSHPVEYFAQNFERHVRGAIQGGIRFMPADDSRLSSPDTVRPAHCLVVC
jgi:hypothetical protein